MFNYTDLPKRIIVKGIELEYLPINKYQPQRRLTVTNADQVYDIKGLSFIAFAEKTNDVYLTFTHDFLEENERLDYNVYYKGKAYRTKNGYVINNNLFIYAPIRPLKLSQIPSKGAGVYSDRSGYMVEYDSEGNFYEYDDIGCGLVKRNPLIVSENLLKMKFAKNEKWFK